MAGGKDPELRIGLVLYGGVSLAVYIYGVVVEVQRLLRASAEFEATKGRVDKPGSAGYAKALRDGGLSRASVDIIAGTSAGGINGILLAKALASGGDVESVRKIWIEEGDIGRLLQRLDEDDRGAWFAAAGILNNKPFTEALQTIFTRSSDRLVRRWLLSVDPDPKPLERPPAPGSKPAFDQIGVSAVTQIPRYQSIASDLESLAEHNAAVRRVNAMVAALEMGMSGGGHPSEKTPPPHPRAPT